MAEIDEWRYFNEFVNTGESLSKDEESEHWKATVATSLTMSPSEIFAAFRTWLAMLEKGLHGDHFIDGYLEERFGKKDDDKQERDPPEWVVDSLVRAWSLIAHDEPGVWSWCTARADLAGEKMIKALPPEEQKRIELLAKPPRITPVLERQVPAKPMLGDEEDMVIHVGVTDHGIDRKDERKYRGEIALRAARERRRGTYTLTPEGNDAQRLYRVLMCGALSHYDLSLKVEAVDWCTAKTAMDMRREFERNFPLNVDAMPKPVGPDRTDLGDVDDKELVRLALIAVQEEKTASDWDELMAFAKDRGIGVGLASLRKAWVNQSPHLKAWIRSQEEP